VEEDQQAPAVVRLEVEAVVVARERPRQAMWRVYLGYLAGRTAGLEDLPAVGGYPKTVASLRSPGATHTTSAGFGLLASDRDDELAPLRSGRDDGHQDHRLGS